ncbi:MAG: hypothetical protein CSYNP_04431 [Syntrophus sp. SKADARSKE-3]|nr:hypothetical protein [Syntrophus sp. SKADARSKE-3]
MAGSLPGRHQRLGCGLNPLSHFRPARIMFDGEQAADHPPDIAVDRGNPSAEGDAQDGTGRVRTDAGKANKIIPRVRQAAAVMGNDDSRRLMQAVGPPVITHILPNLQDVGKGSEGQRFNIGILLQEAQIIWYDGIDLSLLQHHFRQPDVIGIGRPPPGERSSMAFIPGKQTG